MFREDNYNTVAQKSIELILKLTLLPLLVCSFVHNFKIYLQVNIKFLGIILYSLEKSGKKQIERIYRLHCENSNQSS